MFSMAEAPSTRDSFSRSSMLAAWNGDADIARLAEFGDMQVMRRVGAAHVERGRGALGAHHAERGQELLLLVEIGRAQPPIGEIDGFDHRHDNLR